MYGSRERAYRVATTHVTPTLQPGDTMAAAGARAAAQLHEAMSRQTNGGPRRGDRDAERNGTNGSQTQSL